MDFGREGQGVCRRESVRVCVYGREKEVEATTTNVNIYTTHVLVRNLLRFGVASSAVKLAVRLIGITANSLKKNNTRMRTQNPATTLTYHPFQNHPVQTNFPWASFPTQPVEVFSSLTATSLPIPS